jgi:3-isopropylmalate/(R)-2-methylmalate dehydratase large subunit
LVSGKLWFRVPQTIRVDLEGELAEGVFSKDLILWLAGELGADGATYKALEFGGEGLGSLSVEARLTVSNMAIELGGKAGLMEPDSSVLDWLEGRAEDGRRPRPVYPDEGAVYESELAVNLADLVPVVAAPHEVDNVYPVTELAGKAIDQAVIGTCTNGRLEDLRTAADLLEGSQVDPGVRLIVAPASRAIYREASEEGTLGKLVQAGGTVIPPGCGPCLGTHNGIPGDGENIISTANRNFKGRMGNESSFVHLASPATVAASAIEGEITDPRDRL